MKAGLNQLSDCVQRGQPLEEGLETADVQIPAYLAGLLQAGVRSGHLVEVLADLTDYYRVSRDQWRQVWLALTYPCTLLACLALVASVILFWVVPEVRVIYEEFETELPTVTESILWTSASGWKYVAVTIAVFFVFATLIRLIGGRGSWTRVVSSIPGFGALLHWHGFMEFAHLLRLLLLQEVPLPEALRLTSGAIRNANVAQNTLQLGMQVESGIPLADAMLQNDQVPGHLIPLIRLGEQHGELPESLRVISELLSGQIRLRSQLLVSVLPPIIFLFVAGFAVALLMGLFLPLINLISNLAF